MFNRILCPIDGSEPAERALDLAIDLAQKYAASLVLLHVLRRDQDVESLRRYAEVEGLAHHVDREMTRLLAIDDRINLAAGDAFRDYGVSPSLLADIGQHLLDGAGARARQGGIDDISLRLEDGNAAKNILRCIEAENIDCVVMGSRGLGGVEGLFLGSVSHKVVNHAPCTCITVR